MHSDNLFNVLSLQDLLVELIASCIIASPFRAIAMCIYVGVGSETLELLGGRTFSF